MPQNNLVVKIGALISALKAFVPKTNFPFSTPPLKSKIWFLLMKSNLPISITSGKY